MGRDRWDSRTAFVLASIGSAIGLGNIWRFPYVCYKYGGGAFLIAYLVALFSVGIPLLVLEFSLGHKTESAAPRAFKKTNRRLEFFGWGAVCVACVITFYYAVIMAWCFYYGVSAATLAWGDDPAAFFYENTLRLTDGIFDFGGPNPAIVAGLLAAWIFIVLAIWKGAKTVGKVVYLTVLVPWVLLLVFVVRGVSLPGALDGLNYYLEPDFSKLLIPEVWLQAYTQIFFSLSLGFGIMIAYASFLPRKADIINNACLIGLSDAGTAFIGGLAVFGALGFQAHNLERKTDFWIAELEAGPRIEKAYVVEDPDREGAYLAYLVPEGGLDAAEAALMEESPELLLARDVIDPAALAGLMMTPGDAGSKGLSKLVAGEARAALDRLPKGATPDGPTLALMVADLNRIFREVPIEPVAEGPSPEGAALVARNRGTLTAMATDPDGKSTLIAPSLSSMARDDLKAKVKAFPTVSTTFRVVPELPEGAVTGTEIPVQNVVKDGPGLAFITYPTIINELPAGPVFGVLFFLMLLTLAVDSAFSLVEAASASIRDKWGWSHRRSNLTIAVFGLVMGIPFTMGFGLYWLDLVDRFMNNFGLTSICLGECIFLGWALKSKRHEPIDRQRAATLSLRWGVAAFFGTAAVLSAIVGIFGSGFTSSIPLIVIGADAVALFVILAIYTSDHRYTEDLRRYANDQSDFTIGRWWNFLVRYVAPIILIFLIVQEIRARLAAPYEGYPRVAEFLGGWLLLHVIVFISFFFMFRRGREETE